VFHLASDETREGGEMVSAWWLLVAFAGGGFAGVLLIALMHISGGLPDSSQNVPEFNGPPW
jgi:hypothetical protein